jgi:hypothetical protein
LQGNCAPVAGNFLQAVSGLFAEGRDGAHEAFRRRLPGVKGICAEGARAGSGMLSATPVNVERANPERGCECRARRRVYL